MDPPSRQLMKQEWKILCSNHTYINSSKQRVAHMTVADEEDGLNKTK